MRPTSLTRIDATSRHATSFKPKFLMISVGHNHPSG